VETALSLFEIYAALELHCTKKINPYEVITLGHGNIIFLWSDEFESVLSSIASFLIDSVTKRLLSRQTNQLTLIWLDELASLKKLDALDSISRRGRSSGIIPLVGVQTFEGIKHIYSQEIAEQMLGTLPYKIYFRAGTITTAKWAADYLGVPRAYEIVRSFSDMPHQRQVKDNHHMVTPEQLRRIPKPNLQKEDVITGFMDFPDGSAPFEIDVLDHITHPKEVKKRPVPDDWQRLSPFNADDLIRLNFPNALNFI
jgi:type IV secretory pathway TraG/TraD family ATPase VirD4